jgi:3-dehydroquinate synthase
MLTHTVALGDRSYPIHIGDNILGFITDILKNLNPKQKSVVVITEKNVSDLYLGVLNNILIQADYTVHSLILPSGEGTKSFTFFETIARFCLQHHVERNHAIIAFGGGVIGDLTGFVASTVRRGCRFIQIPTTLLSQVDSSVGGKTAINTHEGKNLIGTFYQPSAVLIDSHFLKTLPQRVYRSGYAEVIKYGVLGDKDFFDYLKNNNDLFLKQDTDFLIRIISHCVRMKADIVMRDETEQGERALLNLGHTFGHAYEAQTRYSDTLHHGEAIAIGMLNAAEFSSLLKIIPSEEVVCLKECLLNAGFEIDILKIIPDFSSDMIIKHMMQDKKVSNNKMTLILLEKIGKAYIDKNINLNMLSEYFNNITVS